jgi:TonB-dependent receptor
MDLNHVGTAPAWRRRARLLAYGVSALALGAVVGALPAYAADAPKTVAAGAAGEKPKAAKGSEELVVTGFRQSLQSAQQIKQLSPVFVDSVTAADISALPDRSVTEALQRIPGVAIDRFAAGRDPDHFSVEGNGVVVRGLTSVLSEINGRDSFSATNGRGLNFQDVPSELMAGVDVFKSPSADMIEGGIAGTVNLRTRLPFDAPGMVLAASGEASYGDFVKKWAPTGVLFFSNRWNTSAGEFGIMLNAVRSELYSRSDGQQISDWGRRFIDSNGNLINGTPAPGAAAPTGDKVIFLPRGASFREDTFDHIRTGYGAAGQWRSNDHTMEATLNFLRSDTKQAWTEHEMEIATDNVTSNGDSTNVAGTSLSFDSNGLFTSGTITGNTGWRSDQFGAAPRTPINGLQSNNQKRDVLQNNHVSDYSANFKWTPNDNWDFQADYQHVEAKVTDLDATLWTSTYQNAQIQLRGSDIPVVNFLPPSTNGTVLNCPKPSQNCPNYYNAPHDSFSDPFNSFNRAAMDHIEDSTGDENAFRIDAERKFGGDHFITAIRAGYRFTDRDETTRYSTYNWGVVTEQWGNGGPIWLDQSVGGQQLASQYQTWAFSNFMRGAVPVPTGNQPRLYYTPNIAQHYDQFAAFALAYASAWEASGHWVPLAARSGVVAGTPFLPGEINPVDEKTHAGYVMAKYNWGMGNGWSVDGNIGVRYFHTDRVTQGFLSFPVTNFPNCNVTTNVPQYCQLVSPTTQAQAIAFQNGANVNRDSKTSFDYWLPSWNMKVDIGGGKLFRFAISKGVSFPDIGLTRNFYNVQLSSLATNIFNGSPEALVQAGNPFLKPQSAWSYDASFEWYFGKVGQISFSAFYKNLKDVISNGTVSTTLTNNGATFPVIVTTAINAPGTGKIKGFEIAYQQAFTMLPSPFDGLGINANYTYIDSTGVAQSTLSETDPNVAAGRIANLDTTKLPLQGLSKHNFNVSPFYEKGKIAVRLAYSWRSRYLLTTRDVIVPFAPIMQESMGTLDGSVFFAVNPHVKVGVQGVNLLNSMTRTSSVLNINGDGSLLTGPRSWFMDDRRYTFIVRGTF